MASNFISYWKNRLNFIDVHYHVNPDTYIRRYNALQAGHEYLNLGGGVVLKSHLGCCCAVASTAQSQGLPVFGSIVLNSIAGGVDVRAVHQSLSHYGFDHSGRLIVHLPTIVPNKHRSTLKRRYSNSAIEMYAMEPSSITNSKGKLLPAIEALTELAQNENIVISSGHASREEVEKLVDLCAKKGNVKLMLNQPANPITGMDATMLKSLGCYDWLYIEQTALTVTLGYQSEHDFFEVLHGVNNLIYSSDFGQLTQPTPKQWLEKSTEWFKCAGLSVPRVNEIILGTPLAMLAPKQG